MGLKEIFNQNSKDILDKDYFKNNQGLLKNFAQKNSVAENNLPADNTRNRHATGSGGPVRKPPPPPQSPLRPANRERRIKVMKPLRLRRPASGQKG